MKAHYFIGIRIPEPVAVHLVENREKWALRSHKKYTRQQDMHITLLFIGDDPAGEIEQAAKALEKVHLAPFELTLEGIKTFGNPSTPRIIYASVTPSDRLNILQEQIREKVMAFNMNPDQKPFVPHVTLAGKWAGGPPLEQKMELEPVSFMVTEFSVFRIEPRSLKKYVAVSTIQLRES